MKKTLSILLSVLLLLGTIGFGLSAAAEEPSVLAQGYCGAEGDGTNLSWTLTDDLTLTIRGTGAMATFEESSPWDDALELMALRKIGYETAEEAQQAVDSFGEWSAESFRLYADYLNAYRPLRTSLTVVLEEGVTAISDGTFNSTFQTELTLPASLQQIGDYCYAHDLRKITILGTGAVDGLEVPAFKKDVVYPQTLEDANNAGQYGIGIYYLSILMLSPDTLPTAETHPEMSPEEIRELSDAICAYYAASTGVTGDTKEEVLASLLACVNSGLGTNLTLDDLFVTVEDNGNTTYKISQKVEDAVMARFGFSSIIVFDMGGDPGNYMLYSQPVEKIGGDYVAAPWFTLCAPAGSWTEALAQEKGIAFEAIPRCPVSDEHLVKEGAAIAPTCTEAGHSKGWYCADCGTWLSGESIDPLNHKNAQNLAAADATEAAHGHTAGVWCPDCETWLSGGEVIHNHLGEQTVIKPATDTEEGLVDIVCTVCGETIRYTASTTGPKPDENGNTEGGFWQRITGFFRGFIDWFLRLFKWFGKK